MDTDSFSAHAVALGSARRATKTDALVYPPVSAGFSPHHLEHSGTLSLPLALYQSLIGELVSGLFAAGFQRVAIVNGHGGNSAPLRPVVTELQCQGYAVTSIGYWQPSRSIWPAHLKGGLKDIGHACEFETALQLFLRDEDMANQIERAVRGLTAQLVQPYLADDTGDNFARFGAVAAPIFKRDHPGYYGDPAAATAKTGAQVFDILTQGLAEFLEWFAVCDLVLGENARRPDPASIARAEK